VRPGSSILPFLTLTLLSPAAAAQAVPERQARAHTPRIPSSPEEAPLELAEQEAQVGHAREPAAEADHAATVPRLLLTTPGTQASVLSWNQNDMFLRDGVRAQLESILQVGRHLFITLSIRQTIPRDPLGIWKLAGARLEGVLQDGAPFVLPVLISPAPSKPPVPQRHVLTATLPMGTARLMWLLLKEDGASEESHRMPLEDAVPVP
jgi:hypothetical protein